MGVKVVIVVIAHKGELGAYLSEEWRIQMSCGYCQCIAIDNKRQS